MTTPPLTPDEHRAKAEADLARLHEMSPSTLAYHGLALSAIAHVLAAVTAYLEPPPAPEIPGLPLGWRLTTQQSEDGGRLWGYVLTAPGSEPHISRYRWGSSGTALVAGLREAGDFAWQ